MYLAFTIETTQYPLKLPFPLLTTSPTWKSGVGGSGQDTPTFALAGCQ